MRYRNFQQFWPFYVSQHNHKINRILHVIGSLLGLFTFIGLSIVGQMSQGFFMALIVGYGFAWSGHFVFEKNRPATFQYPLYSFLADWKMLFLILSRKKL